MHPLLILLLLGHILGDFYFQTTKMAENKNDKPKWLLIHSGAYSLCIAAILLAGAELSRYFIFIALGTSLLHLPIDYIKKHIPKKAFTIDQFLHIVTIVVLWRLWGNNITIREHSALRELLAISGHSPTNIILILLGLLILLRPVGILIEKGDIWDFNKDKKNPSNEPVIIMRTTPDENQKGAGKMIGYLERVIVFFLLINGQFGAIAFVLTAKSVIRFPEIGKSTNASSLAEFYIIGTLLSMASVFAVAFLLGLM